MGATYTYVCMDIYTYVQWLLFGCNVLANLLCTGMGLHAALYTYSVYTLETNCTSLRDRPGQQVWEEEVGGGNEGTGREREGSEGKERKQEGNKGEKEKGNGIIYGEHQIRTKVHLPTAH